MKQKNAFYILIDEYFLKLSVSQNTRGLIFIIFVEIMLFNIDFSTPLLILGGLVFLSYLPPPILY